MLVCGRGQGLRVSVQKNTIHFAQGKLEREREPLFVCVSSSSLPLKIVLVASCNITEARCQANKHVNQEKKERWSDVGYGLSSTTLSLFRIKILRLLLSLVFVCLCFALCPVPCRRDWTYSGHGQRPQAHRGVVHACIPGRWSLVLGLWESQAGH